MNITEHFVSSFIHIVDLPINLSVVFSFGAIFSNWKLIIGTLVNDVDSLRIHNREVQFHLANEALRP